MSLINNMLKDLEKRKNEQRESPPLVLTSLPRKEAYFSFNTSAIAISLTILIVITWILSMLLHHRSDKVTPMLNEAVTQESQPQQVNSEWLKPTLIKGITLQIKDNITELTFLLDHAALYHLESNEMKNQLTLVVEDSKLDAELPPTAYLSSGIQHFDAEQKAKDTRFHFNLAPESVVKYINLSSEEKNPELVIAIENARPKAGTIHQSSNLPVKTQAIQSLLSQRYHLALQDAENGRYATAIQNLSSLLKIDPDLKDVRASLAALLIDQGKSPQAKKIINVGLELNPSHLPFIELKARILTQEGKIRQALSLLQSASPPLADNPEYHAFIAALYERTNNNSLAASLYEKLLAMNNHNGNWWFGLGVSLDKLGQERSASDAYTRALTEGHLSPESINYVQTRLKALQETPNEKG